MVVVAAAWEPITLLNASYELLSNNVTLKRAAKLLFKGKAVVHEGHESGKFLRDWPWPKVLILVKYVKIAADILYRPPQVTRKGVLRRDEHRCGYCGGHANTVDHVLPHSRDGAMSWDNLVAACLKCNGRKGNRTPEEAKMPLRIKPYFPRRMDLSRR